jgi:hypothetical protein
VEEEEEEGDVEEKSEPQDLKKLKVAELRNLCKEKGLSDKGKKDELVARLTNEI